VRVETAVDYFRNPKRTYPSMLAAAAVGVAPRVHLADTDRGVAVMDFIDSRPLEDHPGGVEGLLDALGRCIARLQSTPAFAPAMSDFGELDARMLDLVVGAGVYRAGALDEHRACLEKIREAYPFGRPPHVSAHNDVNPFNVLFDGEQLWLVDWELSFGNDSYADVALVANNWADTREREDILLRAWAGKADENDRARLELMRRLSQLFYGCLLSSTLAGARNDEDTDALTPDEFRAAVADGTITAASADTLFALAKMNLRAFVDGCATSVFDDARARCAQL